MDLDLTPTRTPDDTEIDTPPHTHTSAELKHHLRHHHPPPPVVVAYKECMKNHAATIGGHAVDGCGEYMPAPSAAPTDPSSLTCAACGCHRNFHRREPDSPTTAITPPFLDFRRPSQAKRTSSPSLSPPRPPPQYAPHTLLALSTAVAAEEHHQEPVTPTTENPVGRKRSRTKFSQEQKEKMHSFSEKLGWKMQKSDEAAVEEFCREARVSKGVLKVWMHNNKHTFGKRETAINYSRNNNSIVVDGGGRLISLENSINGGNSNRKNEEIIRNSDRNINGSHFQNESGSRLHFHDSNNGSCSSP